MVKRIIILLVVVFCLIIGVWYVGIPDGWLVETAERLFSDAGFSVELVGLGKTPLLGLRVKEVRVKRRGYEVLIINDLNARLDPVSLLLLKGDLSFDGELSDGRLTGRVLLSREGLSSSFEVRSARIEGLGAVKTLPIKAGGVLTMNGEVRDGNGRVYLEIDDLVAENLITDTLYVPLRLFERLKGSLTLKGEEVRIDALSLEGELAYSRLKGRLSGGYFEGTLEIMPEPGFPEGILKVLQPYRKTPGYYVIPLKGRMKEIL